MSSSKIRGALARIVSAVLCLFSVVEFAAAETITPPNPSVCEPNTPPLEPGSTPTYPGRWWNPNRFGTGWDFLYSPLLDAEGKFAVYWFTFDKNGTPTWLIGTLQRTTQQSDGHLRSVGSLYAPYFEYNRLAPDGKPYNAVTRYDKVGEVAVTFPFGTSTRAALKWTWTNGGTAYSGQECIYDAFRDQPPEREATGLNQAFTANWFDPTRAARGIGSWGFDLVVGRTPADNLWHEIVTTQVFDENGKPVWLQYAKSHSVQPPLDNTSDPGRLIYTRSSYSGGVPTTDCTATDQGPYPASGCVKHIKVGEANTTSNFFKHVFSGANAAKIELRVDVSGTTIDGDPAVSWPPIDIDLTVPPAPRPYADAGANVPVSRTTEVDRIVADRTLCVVNNPGDTCPVVVSYTTTQNWVYIEKLNLDTNVATAIPKQGQFGTIPENLPIGSRYKYSLRANDGSVTYSQTAEVRVVGKMVVPDQPPVSLAGDLPAHDPSVGTVSGAASTDGGSARYRIPINVPPGRGGMQPEVSVNYSSSAGNGVAGMGMSLSASSSISRCPRTTAQDGAPRAVMYDENDALCLDGQRLVLVSGTYGRGNAEYRTEIDSFVRVKQYRDIMDGACFTAEAKSGRIADYGAPVDAQTCGSDAAKGRVRPLSGLGVDETWLGVRISDRVGNAMSYWYSYNDGVGLLRQRETLLDAIRYTDSASAAGDRWVRFQYENRPVGNGANDYGAWAAGGGLTLRTKRLIRIYTQVGARSVREYHFRYADPATGRTYSNYSGRSLLREVQECAFEQQAPYASTCLKVPTRFAWDDSASDPNAANGFAKKDKLRKIDLTNMPVAVAPPLRSSVTETTAAETIAALNVTGDLNGDGSREAWAKVRTGTVPGPPEVPIYEYRLLTTTPNRTFGVPIAMTTEEVNSVPGNDDFDLDGLGDGIVVRPGDTVFNIVRWKEARGAWPTAAGASFDSYFERIPTTIPTTANMLRVQTADFDGDGRPDLLFRRRQAICDSTSATESAWNQLVVYFNRISQEPGKSGLFVEGPWRCLASTKANGLVDGEQIVRVGDFDADGRADVLLNDSRPPARAITTLVRVRTTSAGNGIEFFDESAATIGLGDVSTSTGARTTRWMDINGDGLDDYVYADVFGNQAWIVRLNKGNARFSTPIVTTASGNVGLVLSGNRFKYANHLPIADVDGDGRPEILRPAKVAAALCPIRRRDTCGDPGDCDVYACPDDPNALVDTPVVPAGQTLSDGRVVQSLYREWGGAGFDPSAYVMNAVRFVLGPVDPDGLPTITAVDTPTSIVTTLGGTDGSDLYGDGLSDVLTSLGCFNCVAATNDRNPDDPLRPIALPDDKSTSVFDLVNHALVFVNENTGAGQRGASLPHLLPELLSVTTNGFGDQASWDYAPLSSTAGRAIGEMALYTLPAAANTYVDADHVYFKSSMPVVASMWQSNGTNAVAPADMLGARSFQYGYSEAMFNTKGRGFRGFRTITNVNDATAANAHRRLRMSATFLQKFPYSGLLESSVTERATSASAMAVVTRTQNEWFDQAGTGPVARPALNASTTTTYDAATGFCSGQALSTASTFNRSVPAATGGESGWDNYGNLKKQFVVKQDGACDPFVSNHTTAMEATYDTSSTNTDVWWINRLTKLTTASTIGYAAGFAIPVAGPVTTQTMTTDYVWNGDRTLQSVTRSADGLQARTNYRYQAGAFGQPYEVELVGTAAGGARTTKLFYTPDFYFIAKQEDPVKQTVEFDVRASDGQVTRSVDATKLVTRYDYDVFGRAIQTTRLLADGITVVEPPVKSAWTWCTGSHCNAPSGDQSSTQKRAVFRVTTVQDGSPTTAVWYDMLGRAIKTGSRGYDPRTTTFSLANSPWVNEFLDYDAFGLVSRRTTPYCITSTTLCNLTTYGSSTYQYDSLGRTVLKTEPAPTDGGTQRNLETTYSYVGNRTDITVGPPGAGGSCANCLNMKRYSSVLGRIMQTSDALNGVTRHWSDAAGNPIALQDANGNVTSASYNAFGHRLTSTDPNRGYWQFAYDAFGGLYKQTDARNLETFLTRDAIGRIVERRSTQTVAHGAAAEETIVDTWVYDDVADSGYTGLLKHVTRNVKAGGMVNGVDTWKETYAYDDAKRVEKITSTLVTADGRPAETFATDFEYDRTHNRLKVLNYPSGLRIETRYTPYGQAMETRDANLLQSYLRTDTMDPWGNVTKQTYGNNTVGISVPNRGTGQQGTKSWLLGGDNGVLQDSVKYAYDIFGNLGSQTRGFLDEGGVARAYAESYTYDSLHRLTKAQMQESTVGQVGPVSTVNYGYDAVGNLRWKDDYSAPGFGVPYPYQYGSDKPNAVTRVLKAGTTNQFRTYAYDANGNVVGDGTLTNELSGVYDAQNLPRRLARGNGPATKFDYGATGERYRENDNGITKIKLPFGLERLANGKWRHELGPAIVERTVRSEYPVDGTNKVWYAYRDRLGSTIAVADGFGQLMQRQERINYDAFGKARYVDGGVRTTAFNPAAGPQGMLLLGVTQTDRGFTGQQHLDRIQLIHMNGRAYDYQLGRFLSVDPYIQSPFNSQSANAYSYIMNNPLSGVDPSGYWARSPDNSRQCFGDEACQEARDQEFLGGAAGALRASLSYGGAASNGSDVWGEARARSRQTAENRLWTALIVGELSMRDVSGYGVAAAGSDVVLPAISIVSAVSKAAGRANGTPAGRGRTAFDLLRIIMFGPLGLGAGDDDNDAGSTAGISQNCLGAQSMPGGYICSGGGNDTSYIRQDTHPMLGATISTPAPGPDGGDDGDDAPSKTAGPTTTVIGRIKDLKNLPQGERSLLERLAPDLGSPKANWARNYSVLREEMRRGLPIRDASPGDTSGAFLNAERAVLRERGWTFNSRTSYWMPPGS